MWLAILIAGDLGSEKVYDAISTGASTTCVLGRQHGWLCVGVE